MRRNAAAGRTAICSCFVHFFISLPLCISQFSVQIFLSPFAVQFIHQFTPDILHNFPLLMLSPPLLLNAEACSHFSQSVNQLLETSMRSHHSASFVPIALSRYKCPTRLDNLHSLIHSINFRANQVIAVHAENAVLQTFVLSLDFTSHSVFWSNHGC